MRKHNEFIRKTIKENQLSDPYWFNMQLQMVRLDGLLAGYHYKRIEQEAYYQNHPDLLSHLSHEDILDKHVNLIELLEKFKIEISSKFGP